MASTRSQSERRAHWIISGSGGGGGGDGVVFAPGLVVLLAGAFAAAAPLAGTAAGGAGAPACWAGVGVCVAAGAGVWARARAPAASSVHPQATPQASNHFQLSLRSAIAGSPSPVSPSSACQNAGSNALPAASCGKLQAIRLQAIRRPGRCAKMNKPKFATHAPEQRRIPSKEENRRQSDLNHSARHPQRGIKNSPCVLLFLVESTKSWLRTI